MICYGYLTGRLVVVGYVQRNDSCHVFSMRKGMPARKNASRRNLGSDLRRVDAHGIKPEEYRELPELTEEMLARARVNKGGRPKLANPRQLITLRLPADVIERWRATGPGWQTRMAQKISKGPGKER